MDVSKQSKVGSWSHVMGTLEKKYILDADGSGVALIDYDQDGWLDIYLVNGSTFDALDGKETPPTRPSFTTITTEPSPTWPPPPTSPTTAGLRCSHRRLRQRRLARHRRGQLRQEPSLPQQPRRHLHRHAEKAASPSATGPQASPGAITTATAASISSSPATSISTATACP